MKNVLNLEVLSEDKWNLTVVCNDALLDVLDTTAEQKEYIKNIGLLATRCKLENKKITIDFLLPATNAKAINQLVTSAIIQTIKLEIFDNNQNLEFTVVAPLKNVVPDWHMTLGTRTDKLTITCEYETEYVRII